MARVKRGTIVKENIRSFWLQLKGYRGTKSRLVKDAWEAKLHADQYAYHGRKLQKKR